MASRSLNDLDPRFRPKAEAILAACKSRGVDLLVTCTLRGLDEQATLYAQGRTAPGKVVTYARPGKSAHNYGLAMDVVPLRNGKAIWHTGDPGWFAYGEACEAAGIDWAGNWKKFREFPHCQIPNWRSLI